MRLVLLILGTVVAQVWHEDDPQDDATRQLWFEEAREAVLHTAALQRLLRHRDYKCAHWAFQGTPAP